MARETKVGLLAGLAFIICFAIILANRGRQNPVATQPISRLDPGISTPTIAQGLPVRARGRRTPRESSRVSHAPSSERPTEFRVTPQRHGRYGSNAVARVASAGGSDVVLPGQVQPLAGRSSEAVDISSALAATTFENESDLTQSVKDRLLRQRALQNRLDARDGRIGGAVKRPAMVKASTKRSQPSRGASTPSRRYTVKPGDTLTRIALEHYGRGSPSIIDAIFKANRSKLSSPDDLRVGAELVLPLINGVAVASAGRRKAPVTKRSTDARFSPHGGGDFRWYQIKKNDRYVSIAREQLGDANRWREIFELNADKFPDPQRIRHGVRIKLPVTRTASAGRR